jgi:hypothetical protein
LLHNTASFQHEFIRAVKVALVAPGQPRPSSWCRRIAIKYMTIA